MSVFNSHLKDPSVQQGMATRHRLYFNGLSLKQNPTEKKTKLFRDTQMLIRDDDLLMFVAMDGVSLVPLLKKAHLVNSNYVCDCLKVTIQLKRPQ